MPSGGSTLRAAILRSDSISASMSSHVSASDAQTVPSCPNRRTIGWEQWRADRDPVAVERFTDLLGGEAVEHERQHRRLVRRGADRREARDLEQAGSRVGEEVMLVAGDVLPLDPLHVVERGAEPDGVCDARGAGLEADQRGLEEHPLEG